MISHAAGDRARRTRRGAADPSSLRETAGPRGFVESSRSESKDREEGRERREERREERGETRDENAVLQFTCIFSIDFEGSLRAMMCENPENT